MADPEASELYGISSAPPALEPQSLPQGPAQAAGEVASGPVLRRTWTAGQRHSVRNYFRQE